MTCMMKSTNAKTSKRDSIIKPAKTTYPKTMAAYYTTN